MSLPKVKKVQGCHCFQNCKLVDQQPEDHHDPVDASVDFEHVALISNLKGTERFMNRLLITVKASTTC